MSPARRRRRGRGGAPPAEAGAATPSRQGPAPWQWRTFPVYFAFSLGIFMGLYLGIISEVVRDDAGWIQTAFFVGAAIMLGLGLSRVTTRWLLNRRLAQARQRR